MKRRGKANKKGRKKLGGLFPEFLFFVALFSDPIRWQQLSNEETNKAQGGRKKNMGPIL